MPRFVQDSDANRMLRNNIVSFNGELVYVIGVRDRVMKYIDLDTHELKQDFADFDKITGPTEGRLGYVNFPTYCVYFSRIANRDMNMGIHRNNIYLMAGWELPGDNYVFGPLFTQAVYNCLKGNYPSFREAYLNATANGYNTAFDRSFCVKLTGEIVFRGKNVVGFAPDGNEQNIQWNDAGKRILSIRHRPKLKWKE